MFGKFQELGAQLIARLIPAVEASASCVPQCYAQCWQCNYGPCQVWTDCHVSCNG
ncbi:hypothetical protein GCM10010149_45080 [Nonomuraea roseoviolacea subsp. roseoviolacea]|uniref:Uncharacterized protein n=1 Tax=Nonomuraea roseoviolacea subsp. carminata TaxID=160689 RepID=A0ABT1JZ96_9ACTN|nr:hypothetical protein [Nonomuraea roseoviolacea]MCP2347068.1 hypothetical protein [Nonomuraea roseoviolacea subsp. carminata]